MFTLENIVLYAHALIVLIGALAVVGGLAMYRREEKHTEIKRLKRLGYTLSSREESTIVDRDAV